VQAEFLFGPYDGCKVSVKPDVPQGAITMGRDSNGKEVVYVPLMNGTFVYEPMKDCSLLV
jgi:hypothetical protein